jgi:SAM-dependent methyltransferase
VSETFDAREYWEQRLGKEYSLHGVGFGGLGQSYNRWMYRVRAAVFRRVLRELRIDIARAKILDIGSGTGFYVDLLARAGARDVTASDITQVAADALAQRFPQFRAVRLDVSDGVPEGTFDLVTAFDVLFHIVDDARYNAAFANIYASLAPGGRFVFSDNFLHRPSQRLKHQVSRSLADIEQAVRAAGFAIESRRPMFVVMNAPVDADARALERWRRLTRRARESERWGSFIGASLYPIDRALTRVMRESPTTEVMICRK